MTFVKMDDLMHFGVLLSIIVRWAVSRFPYSGAGKPPMHGDYEAQRHWMEITSNLPTNEWYHNSTNNDLMYWGLDYPPLTAYHMMVCGLVARWFDPKWVALNSSRGYEDYHHKIFMRSSVLVADFIFYIAVIVYWSAIPSPKSARNKAIAAGLCLLYPGLILIDHGHFQYNSVSLGLTLCAIIFMSRNYDSVGAAFFTLALQYKQMSLYYAVPFFCYLLGTCFKLDWKERISKFTILACVVITVSGICWVPFLNSTSDAMAVVDRLFPFSRGLYEDKVGNVWCMLSVLIKWKTIFSTSTLAVISAIATLGAILPSSIHLLFNPSMHNFRLALVNSSLSFFLLSFQVHEKSILLPAMPILLLQFEHPLASIWFAYISTFSLVPLLAKDGLIIPFVALSSLFLIGAIRAYHDLLFRRSLIKTSAFAGSIAGSVVLLLCMFTVKQPSKLPHLHLLLNCVYSGLHFAGFLVYFNSVQLSKVFPLAVNGEKIKIR